MQINVDFEFFDAKESDYHGIRSLVNAAYGSSLPVEHVANAVADGKHLAVKGTVIRIQSQGGDSEDDVVGFMAAVDLSQVHHRTQLFLVE